MPYIINNIAMSLKFIKFQENNVIAQKNLSKKLIENQKDVEEIL